MPGFSLAFLAHKGCRWLKNGLSYAQEIGSTELGILAGCTSSTSIARAYAYDTAVASEVHKVPAFQHVDDLSHVITEGSEEAAIVKTLQVASTVASAISRKGLKITNKKG